MYRNDVVINQLSGSMSGIGGSAIRRPYGKGPHVDMADVNAYIAAGLLGTLVPLRTNATCLAPSRMQTLLAQTAPSPACKFFDIQCASLEMDTAPLGTEASTWTDLGRTLGRAARRESRGQPATAAATQVGG